MKFKSFIVNTLLTLVFMVLMFSWAIGTAANYGYGKDFVDNDMINFSLAEKEINAINDQAESWEKVWLSDNPFLFAGGIMLYSLWGILNLLWTGGFILINIVLVGATDVLGIPTIATGAIITLLIVALIFAVWKLIKQGE